MITSNDEVLTFLHTLAQRIKQQGDPEYILSLVAALQI